MKDRKASQRPHRATDLDRERTHLSTSVHGQDAVVSKHVGNLLCERAQLRRVERSARQGQSLGLLDQGTDDLGVAMALVDGGCVPQEAGQQRKRREARELDEQ